MRNKKRQFKKKMYDKEFYFDKSWEGFSKQVDNWNTPKPWNSIGTREGANYDWYLLAYQMNENEEWVPIGSYYGKDNKNNVFAKLPDKSKQSGKFDDCSYEITEEKKDKIINRLLEYYEKNECSGEGIYQNDQSQIDAIEVMSDIADNIIQFKFEDDEER